MVYSPRQSNMEWVNPSSSLGKRKRHSRDSTPPPKSLFPSVHSYPVGTLQAHAHTAFLICSLSTPQSHRFKEPMDNDAKTLSISPRKKHKLGTKRVRLGVRLNSPSKPVVQTIDEPPPKIVDQTGCHTCGRYPKYFHQLDKWVDCERCNERTCYICIRTCEAELGLGCTERRICRKCCIEKGEAGVVFCHDCLNISTMLTDEMLVDVH